MAKDCINRKIKNNLKKNLYFRNAAIFSHFMITEKITNESKCENL